MKFVERGKEKLSKRISAAVSAGTPLRELASNLSVTARNALAEAEYSDGRKSSNSVKASAEKSRRFSYRASVRYSSQPVHQPRTHQSRRRNRQRIKARYVRFDRRFRFARNGIYRADGASDGRIKIRIRQLLRVSEITIIGLIAELVTSSLRAENIQVLINEGFRFTARGASVWLCGVDDYIGRADRFARCSARLVSRRNETASGAQSENYVSRRPRRR